MKSTSSPTSAATVAARGIRAAAPPPEWSPVAEPLYQTAVFRFPSVAEAEPALAGERGYVYARFGLPNARSLEETVATLEGYEDAVATSSGMAALFCTVMACTNPGDTVLCQEDAYGGTRGLLSQDLARLGLHVHYVNAYDAGAVEQALASSGASVLIVETLSNPLMREVPTRALAECCTRYGARLCVDNTFATPIFRRPKADGAALVFHSVTKFLGGHHDLCAGVVLGDRETIARARGLATRFGCTAAPFDAWLAGRGIRTLDVRMERAQANARFLDEHLRHHSAVRALHYPGWGAMLSFDLGSRGAVDAFLAATPGVSLAPSLGGTESTFSHSATSSHRELSPELRARLGIGDGLLRMSVGLEGAADLWRELEAGLAHIG